MLAGGCAANPGIVHPGPPGSSPSAASRTPSPSPSRDHRAAGQLRADLGAIFGAPLTSHAQWGVLVKSLASGELLYAHNADKLMMPASNMKIVTLAAAAEVLGWEARFTTTLETSAAVSGGVLHGDLYVRGGGDPTINMRNGRGAAVFSEWTTALRAHGIDSIDGRIVGDDRLFDGEGLGSGWAWDDLHYGYAAPVGALQFNQNMAELLVKPGPRAGEPARVQLAHGAGLALSNLTTTTPAGFPETIRVRRRVDRPVIEVTGTIPLASRGLDGDPVDGRPIVRQVAVANPTLFFAQALKDALIARGIRVSGDAVTIENLEGTAAVAEATRRVLVRTESPPLREIGAVLMKVSQNLYSESVLKSLGAARTGFGTTAAGRSAVHGVLDDWRIGESGLIMADGSGLSRYNYASPDLLVRILERMYGDARHREDFLAALPIAGRDGTVADRMRRTRAEGNAAAKTGSLSNVRALSGYVRARSGEMLVFSIVANSFRIPGPTVTWIADLAVEVLANFAREP